MTTSAASSSSSSSSKPSWCWMLLHISIVCIVFLIGHLIENGNATSSSLTKSAGDKKFDQHDKVNVSYNATTTANGFWWSRNRRSSRKNKGTMGIALVEGFSFVKRSRRSIMTRQLPTRQQQQQYSCASSSSTTQLQMTSTFGSSRSTTRQRQQSSSPPIKKRSIRDRTPEEGRKLVEDLIKLSMETGGPRVAIERTLQAAIALQTTLQDFLPVQPNGNKGETFRAPVALRKLFERLGATYIKLGQFIASSPTLFPSEYVLEFQKCLDATEPIEWSIIKGVIEKELGGSLSDHFEYVDPTPLASASIAQVHSAKLKSTKQEVVIKVQKPNIDNCLKADLSFLLTSSKILEFLNPDLERTSLSAIASDIRTSMLEELNFQKEATNIQEFRLFLEENQLLSVATAPRVYDELTTKKVLVMEKLQGVSMLDIDSIRQISQKDPEQIIITALNVWTTSVMTMPWFHADVHAGNLLVLKDGRVGFIDFGIVGRVSPKTFSAVESLSSALALGDYRGMALALCNMGATSETVDIDKFAVDLQRVMENLAVMQPTDITMTQTVSGEVQGSIGFDETELTEVMLDLVDVAESNGLKLPREFGLLVKQSLYFDRYLKILAPTLNVLGDERIQSITSKEDGDEIVIDV